MRRVVMGAMAAALLAGCGNAAQEASPGQASRPAPEAVEERAGDAAGGGGGAGGEVSAVPLEGPGVEPTVIKTADLDVRVERDGFGDAMGTATDVAARHGGFVLSSTRGGDDARRGSVTIRVPSDAFEAALGDLRALGEVRREHVGGEDVGQEFVDLEARLRNLEAQEAVLLRLFDDATSVADTIRIQQELSGVQLDIEQIEGRLRYLRDQTAFATITVSLSEEGADEPGVFARAWDQAVSGFVAVAAGLVVVLGFALPFALIAAIAFVVVRRVMRRPVRTEA